MTDHEDNQRATGLMRLGIQRLAEKYPFHVRVLERLDLRSRPSVGTMGVTVVGDHVRLLYNPGFVNGISVGELGGVLLHEVHHVVFGHPLANPQDYPDRWARIVAEEVTVNEFVSEPLPGNAIRREQFTGLPERESTDWRYRRLRQKTNRFPLSSMSEMFAAELGVQRPEAGTGTVGVVPDNHATWDEVRANAESDIALHELVHDAVIDIGFENVPDYLHRRLRCIAIGHTPGDAEELLAGGQRGQLDWVRLLRKFVGQHAATRSDFCWPARRFPDLLGVVPGKRRGAGRARVMAAVDTSGSLTRELLDLISAELARLAADYEVTVVECDAEIQRVYRYRPIRSVHGRGGTDLRPPFDPAFQKKYNPDLVIYFTDGCGVAPKAPPAIPVLWCLTPVGRVPAEWGVTVKMSTLAHRNSVASAQQ